MTARASSAGAAARTARLVLATVVAALLALGVAPLAGAQERPSVDAASAIVVETTTGDVAYQRAPDRRRPIASATKLMTALLVLEGHALSERFSGARYRPLPVESQLEPSLRPGEKMTVADLLRGLLLESANDAAVTIAENVAGTQAAFVRAMNARSRELGLSATRFVDPIGIGAGNRSSARDLVRLTLELRAHRFFRRIVARTKVTLESGDRPRTVVNRNKLVSHAIVDGVKTGHTSRAGYVLVGSGRNDARIRLVSVVLGASSEKARNDATLALLRYGFRQYRRDRAVQRGGLGPSVPIRFRRGAELQLVAKRTFERVVPRGERLTTREVGVPADVAGPIRQGQRVAAIEVLRNGKVIATVPLVARDAVPAAGLGQRTKERLTDPLMLAAALAALAASVLLMGMGVRRRRGRHNGRARRQTPEAA